MKTTTRTISNEMNKGDCFCRVQEWAGTRHDHDRRLLLLLTKLVCSMSVLTLYGVITLRLLFRIKSNLALPELKNWHEIRI